jgi:hypothetical protein
VISLSLSSFFARKAKKSLLFFADYQNNTTFANANERQVGAKANSVGRIGQLRSTLANAGFFHALPVEALLLASGKGVGLVRNI